MPCYLFHLNDGSRGFICGDLGPLCSDAKCGDVSGFQCDFPVGDGQTCDAWLCKSHAFAVAPDIHYCPGHALMWRKFVEDGGVKTSLENVVPFSSAIMDGDK